MTGKGALQRWLLPPSLAGTCQKEEGFQPAGSAGGSLGYLFHPYGVYKNKGQALSRQSLFTPSVVAVHAGSLSDARMELKLLPLHLDYVVPQTTILADPKDLVVGQVVQVAAVE